MGEELLTSLVQPDRIWQWTELRDDPQRPPAKPGVYAWWFRSVPPGVPLDGALERAGLWLLYVRIAPKSPQSARRTGGQTLRSRIRYHYRGNACGSTLRLTLGILLQETLGIRLQRVSASGRLTFGNEGEALLTEWMVGNALVSWVECPDPWEVEKEAIVRLYLPFNLDGGARHPFCMELSRRRAEARQLARTTGYSG